MNTSQLKWRWTAISLTSLDNPSQKMLLYFTEFQVRPKSALRGLICYQLQQEKSYIRRLVFFLQWLPSLFSRKMKIKTSYYSTCI